MVPCVPAWLVIGSINGDIENADDDESHDDIRQQARRANRKAIARTVDEEVKDIFLFCSFRRCHLHSLQSYLSGRTSSSTCASNCRR